MSAKLHMLHLPYGAVFFLGRRLLIRPQSEHLPIEIKNPFLCLLTSIHPFCRFRVVKFGFREALFAALFTAASRSCHETSLSQLECFAQINRRVEVNVLGSFVPRLLTC